MEGEVATAAAPTPSSPAALPEVLPYNGDKNLNVAIQTALGKNDTQALRILFQAQKSRSRSRNQQPRGGMSVEDGARLRQAMDAVGVCLKGPSRKRKRSDMQSETKEEDVMREEKHDDDDGDADEGAEGGNGNKVDLIEACKVALKSYGIHQLLPQQLVQPHDASSSVALVAAPLSTPDGVTPQLLRTLSTESLWHYTQAVGQPGAAPRRILSLLRGISQLQYNNTITSEAGRLLKLAVGKGQVEQVETILREVYHVAATTMVGGGEGGRGGGSTRGAEGGEGGEDLLNDDGLQAEFLCPITQDLFYEPSTLTCGHTFERQGILDHLKACQRSGNPSVCPSCRKPISRDEHKKLGVNKVLQGLLRRFYSAQMESLAEREVEKAASAGPGGAERMVEILERYPQNVTILRRTVAAFEAWAKDHANIKPLATDRIIQGLVRALRDPLRLSLAKERAGGMDLGLLVTGMLALLTQEVKACRTLIKLGFLKDVVGIIASETTTVEALVLVRNLMVPDGFSVLVRRGKKDATTMPSVIQHLNGISIGLFNASNRPAVHQDSRLSIFLLAGLNRLARLAAHEGILACQVDFSALARAVVTLWDHHPRHPAVAIRAVRTLRSLLDLTAPSNTPDGQTPQACLAHTFYLDRCLRALTDFGSSSAPEAKVAVGETIVFLVALSFDDRGGKRDVALIETLARAGVLAQAEMLLQDEVQSKRLLGMASKTLDDFRFEQASDPSRVTISEDGKQAEIVGAGWVLGPPISKEGQTSILLELGKAGCNRETLWWGVCVMDREMDEGRSLPPDMSANTPNSPFVVRREGALYAQGRSDRYLYLAGWRDAKVLIKIDLNKKCVSFGSAKVGWQSLEGKVVRPAIVSMPLPGSRAKPKYKVTARDFSSGFLMGPQAVRMKPITDHVDYLGRGKVARRTPGGGGEQQPVFAFAIGPGEVSEEDVLFRFRGMKKSTSSMCFGVIGILPTTLDDDQEDQDDDQGAGKSNHKMKASGGRSGSSKKGPSSSSSGGGGGSKQEVAFILTIMSTGDVSLRGPSLRPVYGRARVFGPTARRQVRVSWGPRGGIQVLSNALGAGKAEGSDGEVLWDSKTALRSLLSSSSSDLVLHPFVGLQRGGDWAAVRIVRPQLSQAGGRLWLRRCLESARKVGLMAAAAAPTEEGGGVGGPSSAAAAVDDEEEEEEEDHRMREIARSGLWDVPEYASLLRDSLAKEAKDHLEALVPVPKRNKTTVHTYGYDINTIRELARSRYSVKVQRMNIITQPELTQETVHINKVLFTGHVERLWVVALKWHMDHDLYRIEAVQEVPVPEALSAPPATDGGENGSSSQQVQHECFELDVDPPFRLEAGLNLGLAMGGASPFIRGYRNNKFVQQEMVVMAMSDDVARDMVLGKEICMEEQTEETAIGLGYSTVEGLPDATCTNTDVVDGAYRVGQWEMPESSDEEGVLRSNQRYRRLRYDVFLRSEGGAGGGQQMMQGGPGGAGVDEDDENEGESDGEMEAEGGALMNFL